MKFTKRLFFAAAIYGVIALVPQYFLEEKNGRDFPPPINHPEYFYGFVGVALAWQILFFSIAADPVRLRPAMLPGALEKIGFGGAAVILYLMKRTSAFTLAVGIIDLIFATLFLVAMSRTPNSA